MKQTAAATADAYVAGLSEDRRKMVETVRQTILQHLPAGYEEAVNWGMITYQVPLETSGPTYNGQPLMYAAIASQKRHVSLYLTAVYADPDAAKEFRERYVASGKRLDMGKSCVRFGSLEDLPLDLIGETIAATPVDEFLELQESVREKPSR